MLKDYAPSDYDQRGFRGGNPGAVVGLLHEEARDSSQMNLNKSNREGMEKREPAGDGVARHVYALGTDTFPLPGTQHSQMSATPDPLLPKQILHFIEVC